MGDIFNTIINKPLGFLINVLYNLFNNYAVALLLFAVVIKVILLPLRIQQQKSQIRMAKIRPKEQAIRKKYAGRTDSVTQQKMQSEVMDMYKSENYSPMSGCFPLLIQLPILWALYSIIRNPLTYIAGFSKELITQIKVVIFDFKGNEIFADIANTLSKFATVDNAKTGLTEIDIIHVFARHIDEVKSLVASSGIAAADIEKFNAFKNINFGFLGQDLTSTPAQMGLSILLLIPLLNFAGQFLQMRMQRMINANTGLNDAAGGKSMKIMEYTMPLFIVYFSYSIYAAVGLYYIYQSIIDIGLTLILAQIYPIPKISDEEYKLAEQQYGSGSVKKKKKKPPELSGPDSSDSSDSSGSDGVIETEFADDKDDKDYKGNRETEGSEDNNDNSDSSNEDNVGDKYISKTIPKGINPQVKNNYQKTGKKYNIKRRKK